MVPLKFDVTASIRKTPLENAIFPPQVFKQTASKYGESNLHLVDIIGNHFNHDRNIRY